MTGQGLQLVAEFRSKFDILEDEGVDSWRVSDSSGTIVVVWFFGINLCEKGNGEKLAPRVWKLLKAESDKEESEIN